LSHLLLVHEASILCHRNMLFLQGNAHNTCMPHDAKTEQPYYKTRRF